MKRGRSTSTPNKRQHRRIVLLKEEGCIACWIDHENAPWEPAPGAGGELHHFNLDGKAGQRRLGHDDSVVLCPWHHQGVPPPGDSSLSAKLRYGPSLKFHSREFRERYGDDASLLARSNQRINHAYCIPARGAD